MKVAKKGYTGVYYRDTPDGRRYEITYLDRQKVRRWAVVPATSRTPRRSSPSARTRSGRTRTLRQATRRSTRPPPNGRRPRRTRGWASATRERYDTNLRIHLSPRFGDRKLQEIDGDDVAELVAELTAAGKAAWTVRNVLTTLSALFRWASGRRKLAAFNPVRQLEKHERPKTRKRKGRTLQPRRSRRCSTRRPPTATGCCIAVAIFTGLRLQELLALRWQDVDFDAGEVRIRHQLSRKAGELVEVKSDAGIREVTLRPQLAQVLRHHKAASPRSLPGDFVFAALTGGPMGCGTSSGGRWTPPTRPRLRRSGYRSGGRSRSCTTPGTRSGRC